MTTNVADITSKLNAIALELARWMGDAQRLRDLVHGMPSTIDKRVLEQVEITSGEIYRGIAEFDLLVADVDKVSHSAAGQIGEVGDALRLVLMDITELGTRLYALRTAEPKATKRKGRKTAKAKSAEPLAAKSESEAPMQFTVEYRHKDDGVPRVADAATATAVLKMHDHLQSSEAEVLAIRENGQERLLGEIKNAAGQKPSGGKRA